MKAIIMAGGEGKRLRPITDTIPKPLIPIGQCPCIVRILSFLRTHGVDEAAITVGYLSDTIISALGRSCEGVELTYLKESSPLGTAGGVKSAKDFVRDEDFIVISGDALAELDLSKAISVMKRSGADALMVLTHSPEPGEYGVVLTDGQGFVTGFSEKPSLSSTFSDCVNTGIYVMSPRIFSEIPEGKSDFSKDIFPAMLSRGERIATYTDNGYWCDIGDFHSLRKACLRYGGGGNAVGKNTVIPPEGVIGSVLFDNVRVGRKAIIENSIICSDVTVGEDVYIGENCVIGSGSVIGNGSVICDGSIISSGTEIPDGSTIRRGGNLSPSSFKDMMDENGLRCNRHLLSPSFLIKLGSALSHAVGMGRIGIMTDGSRESERITTALIRGISDSGGESVLLGEGFEAAASYAASLMKLDLSLFIRERGKELLVSFFDQNGLYPKREFERSLTAAMTLNVDSESGRKGKLSRISFTEECYLPMAVLSRCPLEGLKISVKNNNKASQTLARALTQIGAVISEEGLRLSVSDDGFSLTAEQDGFTADDWHIKALMLRYLIRERVALPISCPSVIKSLCHKSPELYSHCPSGEAEDVIRERAGKFPELIHAAAAACELCGLISVSERSLKELISHLPSFALSSCTLRINDKRRFSVLTSLGTPAGDGIVSEYEKGSVRVIPKRDGYSLISEAASGEYAEELISLSEKEILRLLRDKL